MATTLNEPPEAPVAVGPGEPTTSDVGVGPGRPPQRRTKTLWRILWVALALVVLVSTTSMYRYFAAWESTDDAEIDGYIFPVSSRVSGYVTRVTVDDNQFVQAGTVLVQLDRKDYDVAVANAKATLANDQATADAVATNVPITSVNTTSQVTSAQADLESAQAGLSAAQRQFDAAQAALRQTEASDLKAQDDVNRYQPLAAKDEIPQQRYTQAVDAQKGTAAAVDAARESARASGEAVTQARAKIAQAEAEVRSAATRPEQMAAQHSRTLAAQADTQRAAAALEQAQLNLQYTTVVAPVSGIVGQRSVQPGQFISPGQQLMTIVPLDTENIWVTANFKETQLEYMRPGQPVRVYVDTYGRTYDGHVLNIAGASGARFSLLPPENATGNYVKVVQRIPVKILFEKGQDPEHLLRPGMSVEPDVRVEQ